VSKGARRFVVADVSADIAEKVRQLTGTWVEKDPFVNALVAEFEFKDRSAVVDLLADCQLFNPKGIGDALSYAFAPNGYDERDGDTLLDLHDRLSSAIDLLADDTNAFRLFREMGRDLDHDQRIALDTELLELADRLRQIKVAAKGAHHEFEDGTSPWRQEIQKFIDVLAKFWVAETGKKFTWNHNTWFRDEGGVERPKQPRKSDMFVFRVVKHFCPIWLPELKEAGRDYQRRRRLTEKLPR
jgi:hypothetical protein